MSEQTLVYLDRIARASEASVSLARRTRKEIRELVVWIKRLTLVVALWASGIGLHLTSEQGIELVAAALSMWAKK